MSATAPDPAMLSILVCPLTRAPLRREGDEMVSPAAGLAFPIRDGVPVMLVEAARVLPTGQPAA